jgi:hypothetical protein
MAPTVVPEDMGHIAIPMVEIVRGNMQSAIPSGVTSQTLGGSTAASSSREVPSEAEVRFCFSAVETLFHIRYHLRSYNMMTDILLWDRP